MITVEAVGSVVRIDVAGCKVDLTIGEASRLYRDIIKAMIDASDARAAEKRAAEKRAAEKRAAEKRAAETPTTDSPSLGIDAGSGGMSPKLSSGHRPAGGPSVEEDASRGSARVPGGRP